MARYKCQYTYLQTWSDLHTNDTSLLYSKLFHFKVILELCRDHGRKITIKLADEKIHISRTNEVPKDSTCSKYTNSHKAIIPSLKIPYTTA